MSNEMPGERNTSIIQNLTNKTIGYAQNMQSSRTKNVLACITRNG
uniref:Uncharacterized protein n=1 Tax=Rhizophora mucronata TaxID=61149 RepID=A0A2P2PLY7_RHIMU